jgi:hypothetical protein
VTANTNNEQIVTSQNPKQTKLLKPQEDVVYKGLSAPTNREKNTHRKKTHVEEPTSTTTTTLSLKHKQNQKANQRNKQKHGTHTAAPNNNTQKKPNSPTQPSNITHGKS